MRTTLPRSLAIAASRWASLSSLYFLPDLPVGLSQRPVTLRRSSSWCMPLLYRRRTAPVFVSLSAVYLVIALVIGAVKAAFAGGS